MLCGVAGVLLANLTLYVSPSYLAWTTSGELIVMVALGGMGTLFGPVAGALAFLLLEEGLAADRPLDAADGPADRGRGAAVAARPVRRLAGNALASGRRARPALPHRRTAMSALRVEHLLKRYGGLTVTDDLSLEVRPGELHAVIGPNGAGKTTLIGQLSGELRPDGGRVLLDGVDVTRMPIERRVRRGLARSYQITSVFKPFTALENVAMAVQARRGHSFRFWRPARATPALREPARAALELAGLGRRADVPAGALAHGELRQLELAMVLACRPTLLLLDEPMAGMSQHESEAMTALLHGLRRQYSILLVEHDMQAVFALSDRVTVLVYGRVLACGSADEIRNDPQVRECYLGSERRRADRRPQESRHERAVAARRHAHYGASQALFGIDLEIGAGEFVSLLGRNGMGKSTTVKAIMGLNRASRARSASTGATSARCRPTRWRSAASAWCPRAGTFSPICRCARTWSPPRTTASG